MISPIRLSIKVRKISLGISANASLILMSHTGSKLMVSILFLDIYDLPSSGKFVTAAAFSCSGDI